ncbi:hypothetical protein GT370_04130 [Acidocella sp. MX-AZ03]|nr:hypothetical protein [Acidocella sp. MX-AZ03]WBO60054.1 hypothetical protein GT370_04130 [Acidocella sp. MX-AZ03]
MVRHAAAGRRQRREQGDAWPPRCWWHGAGRAANSFAATASSAKGAASPACAAITASRARSVSSSSTASPSTSSGPNRKRVGSSARCAGMSEAREGTPIRHASTTGIENPSALDGVTTTRAPA